MISIYSLNLVYNLKSFAHLLKKNGRNPKIESNFTFKTRLSSINHRNLSKTEDGITFYGLLQ